MLLREQFQRPELWESLPAMPGAVEACLRLDDAGYELVCVTALESRFQKARLNNLKALGFPIRRVITTGHQEGDRSPRPMPSRSCARWPSSTTTSPTCAAFPPRCTRRWCCARPTAARTSAMS